MKKKSYLKLIVFLVSIAGSSLSNKLICLDNGKVDVCDDVCELETFHDLDDILDNINLEDLEKVEQELPLLSTGEKIRLGYCYVKTRSEQIKSKTMEHLVRHQRTYFISLVASLSAIGVLYCLHLAAGHIFSGNNERES